MKLRTRIVTAGTALALISAVGVLPAAASASAAPVGTVAAAAKPAATSVPVTGTLSNGAAFTGAISNLTASAVNGVLQVTGTITGTGLPAAGVPFTAPVQNLATPNGCTILTLDLGPLNLNLLGLVVDLAPVNLDVTAVPGAGNLLGNLLCAVAGLLDGNGPLQGIAALLNRLLTGLGL
jgi:hypothetical protein